MTNLGYSAVVKTESNQLSCKNSNEQFDCSKTSLECYHCKDCKFTAVSIVDVKEHMKDVHTIDLKTTPFLYISTKYTCKGCLFQTYCSLRRLHHTTQTGCPLLTQKTFECSQCDLKTLNRYYLKKHIQFKHRPNTKWFNCDHCKYQSKYKSNLSKHVINKHTAEDEIRWFRCDDCEYKSTDRRDVKRHVTRRHAHVMMKLAADDSWLQCEHCEYKSKDKWCLKVHIMRRHTADDEIRWFRCDHCEYKSTEKSNLKAHVMRRHTADDQICWFKCEICEYKSKYKCDFNKHIVKKHPANV